MDSQLPLAPILPGPTRTRPSILGRFVLTSIAIVALAVALGMMR